MAAVETQIVFMGVKDAMKLIGFNLLTHDERTAKWRLTLEWHPWDRFAARGILPEVE